MLPDPIFFTTRFISTLIRQRHLLPTVVVAVTPDLGGMDVAEAKPAVSEPTATDIAPQKKPIRMNLMVEGKDAAWLQEHKPRMVGVRFTPIPPKRDGREVSGLCCIM